MAPYGLLLLLLTQTTLTIAFNTDYLKYLDPTKLQTTTKSKVQTQAASGIIKRYTEKVTVEVNPELFSDKKDVFTLCTVDGRLQIRASSGVAAVWGFNYYLKKYCKSQIEWRGKQVNIPNPLPEVNETIVANDRFRYYQNVCTFSYSFVWWDEAKWVEHIEWMALNGINLALAPIDQEAIWKDIYRDLGMEQDEIDEHTTGPAFLTWFRMGNVRGWGGPLYTSWHKRQRTIQNLIVNYMYEIGMIPILPTFNGHVPPAFARLFPNSTFYSVKPWNRFDQEHCCGLFLSPNDPLFNTLGKMFLQRLTTGMSVSHIYTSDPFNEVKMQPWSTTLIRDTAKAIFKIITDTDEDGVWLIQNWMFVHDPDLWPIGRVRSFLTSIPQGRMLILDLQSEQWPQYDLYQMYYGQPFIWCMLHNFGGTFGMFGNTESINSDVYQTRAKLNSTMIGIGLTPEGINQNYVVYDLMLESAWRKGPVDLQEWVDNYAERRYGCNQTSTALGWKYLLRSVYSFKGFNRVRGKYVITRRPSFRIRPWAWYASADLLEAFKHFVFTKKECDTYLFYLDLVDVTRQVLQYRAEQLYNHLLLDRNSNTWVFNSTINQFLDAMHDMLRITASHDAFTGRDWFGRSIRFAKSEEEVNDYTLNARNQITLWGPNGEITDYAAKQWAELFRYYYIPRWRAFLSAALEAKEKNEIFDGRSVQRVVRETVEKAFLYVDIYPMESYDPVTVSTEVYHKWMNFPGLQDLPLNIIKNRPWAYSGLQRQNGVNQWGTKKK